MLKVGLTGGMASGKSTVAKLLVKKGAKSLNSDQLVHQLFKKKSAVYLKIIREFGESVLNKSKNIDRKKLAEIVFNYPKKLKKLEQIVHPLVIKEINQRMNKWEKSKRVSVAVVEIPLLFEKKLEKHFDSVIVVTAPVKAQLQRSLKKGYRQPKEIRQRLRAQMKQQLKAAKADYVVGNNGSLAVLKKKVDKIWKQFSLN